MDAKQVLNRIGKLQEFEVQMAMPKSFCFNGTVPFDMEIVGGTAFITVLAESIEEATQRAHAYMESMSDE